MCGLNMASVLCLSVWFRHGVRIASEYDLNMGSVLPLCMVKRGVSTVSLYGLNMGSVLPLCTI